jgi:hypothetical protein
VFLGIARYAVKGPIHAATVVGILAILSLFIPLVSILSGAIVALIILTQGLVSGTRVILVSIAGITLVIYLVFQNPWMGPTIGLVQWLPLIVLAEVLRRSRSLSLTLLGGMAMAMAAVVLQFLLWPEAEQQWTQIMQAMFGDMAQQPEIDAEQFAAGIGSLVHWMIVLLMAVMYSTFIATLLAGRWFQARLAGSSGFREEFYAIRLGKGAALVTLGFAVASILLQVDMVLAMAMVAMATFVYQGLAIVHSWSKRYQKPFMLVALYIMMIVFPQVVGMIAALGVIDNWMDFRAKFKSVPVNTDD